MKMKTMVLIGVIAAVVLAIVATVVGVSVSGGSGSGSSSSAGVSMSKGPAKAVVKLNVGNENNGVTGELELSQENESAPVRIEGEINNLKPAGKHGFHVHESGDIRKGCASTGGHYNPHGKTHGAPTSEIRHIGDLGNIEADASGKAIVDITDDKITLSGPNSIIGRAFVVHEGIDDLGTGGNNGSLATGNAGGRLACGIIGTIFQKPT